MYSWVICFIGLPESVRHISTIFVQMQQNICNEIQLFGHYCYCITVRFLSFWWTRKWSNQDNQSQNQDKLREGEVKYSFFNLWRDWRKDYLPVVKKSKPHFKIKKIQKKIQRATMMHYFSSYTTVTVALQTVDKWLNRIKQCFVSYCVMYLCNKKTPRLLSDSNRKPLSSKDPFWFTVHCVQF